MNMSERGRLGGIARNGTTMAQHRRDVEECRAYLAARRAAGNKTTTLQKTFSGLSVFYTFLEDAELYSGSAMRDIRNIKKTYLSPYKSDAETRQLISIEQAAEMIRRTIKTRDRAILAVLFTTGVRAGEMVAWMWEMWISRASASP